MDKLYWIACDDKDTALFEGRYQGRTRGGALKFLKETLGRKSLNGLVFTITEIPVPLIREIVAEILAGNLPATTPTPAPAPAPQVEHPATPADAAEAKVTPSKAGQPTKAKPTPIARDGRPGNPGFGEDLWAEARAHWEKCRCIRKTAEHFGLSQNSVKTRARREGWRK
jgi:hypothetical protein